MNVARQLQYAATSLPMNMGSLQFQPRRFFVRKIQTQSYSCRCSSTSKSKESFSSFSQCRSFAFAVDKNDSFLSAAKSFFKTSFQRQQRTVSSAHSKVQLTINNVNKNVQENILVFSQENDSFYKFLSFFGVFQMIMWGYLSLSPVQNLKTAPVSVRNDKTAEMPWWKRWLYKEGQYKNAITGIFLTVGASILFVSLTYPRRAVKSLWLLKGGGHIKVVTHSPFKNSQSFSVPVDNVNCLQARTGSGTQIPLKIKDKAFFFLMDKQGTFHHPEMFDFVIGLKRKL